MPSGIAYLVTGTVVSCGFPTMRQLCALRGKVYTLTCQIRQVAKLGKLGLYTPRAHHPSSTVSSSKHTLHLKRFPVYQSSDLPSPGHVMTRGGCRQTAYLILIGYYLEQLELLEVE